MMRIRVKDNSRENSIQREYDRLAEYCAKREIAGNFLDQTVCWQQGVWKDVLAIIDAFGIEVEGKVWVDFGCKYGHLAPLLVALRAQRMIGIEVEDTYIEAGKPLCELYSNVDIVPTDEGYVPLQPESVDVVFMLEVISHINPGYLDTVFSEIARVLKQGGVLLISDGNNVAYPGYFENNLIPFYEAWENGPDGTKTDRDTVTRPFITRRAEMIRKQCPGLPELKVDYLARNTSGLFGDFLVQTIDQYVKTGKLIERPYRKGMCPVNPSHGGAVIERALHPLFIQLALESHGFKVQQLVPATAGVRVSVGWFKGLFASKRGQEKQDPYGASTILRLLASKKGW
jgi:SAM-dependent methyltransferase